MKRLTPSLIFLSLLLFSNTISSNGFNPFYFSNPEIPTDGSLPENGAQDYFNFNTYCITNLMSSSKQIFFSTTKKSNKNHPITTFTPTNKPYRFVNLVGTSKSGTTITKTSETSWMNAGGTTNLTLSEGDYITYKVAASKSVAVGLSSIDQDCSFTTIENCMYTRFDNKIYIYENGESKLLSAVSYTSSSLLKILIEGGKIKYYCNGTLLYQRTAPLTSSELVVDFSMYSQDSQIIDLQIYKSCPNGDADNDGVCGAADLCPGKDDSIDVNENGIPDGCDTAITERITSYSLTNSAGISASQSGVSTTKTISKTTATAWGNSGGSTNLTIADGGFLTYKVKNNVSVMMGLSVEDSDKNFASIGNGLYTRYDNKIYVYEMGVNKSGIIKGYTEQTEFKISYQGGRVNYFCDGNLIYVSSTTYTNASLVVDYSLYDANAQIIDLQLFENCQTNTITLASGSGAKDQELVNTSTLSTITYNTTGATGASLTGLPPGVSGAFSANHVTISGTPTQAGTFNYSVDLTGGCGTVSTTGTITVHPLNTISLSSSEGTNNQELEINNSLTSIVYDVAGATGADVSGLPTGVTGAYNATTHQVTIGGTPTVVGAYDYTITLTGGYGTVTANGTITILPVLSSTEGTNNQEVIADSELTDITYDITGATEVTVTDLPEGVSYTHTNSLLRIKGTPSAPGSYTYTVIIRGGVRTVIKTGSITVRPLNTIALTSASGTNSQTSCVNVPITSIKYVTTGARSVVVNGLPTGVSKSFSSNTLTISGIPEQIGTFPYTIILDGGYGNVSTTGTITIKPNSSIVLSSESDTNYQALDINTPLTNIVYETFNTNEVTFTGLPNGVTGASSNGIITISGAPTIIGTFPYTINALGDCLASYETGIITVNTAGSTATNGGTGSNGTSGNNGGSQSQNFADTKGELQISSSGTATYTLPIATPPSLKNVAPVINLTYSSGVRGGIAGQGWNINSISTISRMATRRDIDGFIDGVDFDDNDKLALDGQRLLLKTGTYWANGSTYETEYKSNTKIELIIENGGNATFFIVTSPDGSRTWYGAKGQGSYQNATSVNAWYIVRFEDTNGNNIEYNYSNVSYNNTNQLYIKSIAFSANQTAGIAPQNKIVFNYRNAKRVERDYLKGGPVYATKILDNIQVFANDALFRRYQLTQTADSDLGYERVTKVQEFNGNDEPSNPVFFEYDTTPQTTNRIEKFYDNNLNFSDIDTAGDFDGDGRLDFAVNNQLFTNLFTGDSGNAPINMPFTSDSRKTLSVTTLSNNKLNQHQSILNVGEGLNGITFNIYNYNTLNNQVTIEYQKSVPLNNTITCIDICADSAPEEGYISECTTPEVKKHNSYMEGDFNGDGISEVLILSFGEKMQYEPYELNPNPSSPTGRPQPTTGCRGTYTFLEFVSTSRIIDLNPNASTALNSSGYYDIPNGYQLGNGKRFVADFNSDGKSDIIVINNDKTYKVFSFKQLLTSPWIELETIGVGTLADYSDTKQILFGDYNGDGKTDIMLPDTEGDEPNKTLWHIYYCNPKPNGGELFVKESHNIVEYAPTTAAFSGDDELKTQTHFSSYYAMDVNGDGKSDMVRVWRKYYKPEWTINDHNTAWQVTAYTNNTGNTSSVSPWPLTYNSDIFLPNFGGIYVPLSSNSPDIPIPITSNYRYHGANTDLVIVRGHYNRIEYYQFNKDLDKDNRLKSVTESNGNIIQTIEYKPMEATNFKLGEAATDFYSSNNEATYPNLEIIRNTNSYLVSKLTATINGVSKFQDFKYRSYVSNFNYGTVGFAKTSRSSWYLNESDTKIWTTQYNDTSLRGANTITWSSTNAATVFATIPDNLLSTKTNIFQTYTNPTSKVYNVLLHQQITEDALTGIKSENTFTYDGNVDAANYFGLQTQTVAKQFSGATLQGTTTTINEYESNPSGFGASYYIGRPTKVNTSTTIYTGDTRTSEEKYTYTGTQLTKTEKKGHNTDYAIVEDMTYDIVGNLLTKTVSAPLATTPVASRTITDEYGEPTKRFVTKKTDHQGFVTLFEYNSLGQLKESTNYLGVVSEYSYDNWGKLGTTITRNASDTPLVTTIGYTKLADGGYTTTSWNVAGDNAKTITQYDVQGRAIKTTTKGFALNTSISKEVVYDGLGRKLKESEPYSTTASRWTTYEYDYLQRPTKITAPSGRVQTLAYSGLTTTSIDDGKTTTATVDALGNKIQTTDPGGTINFTYYANGQLKESDYEGHKVTISIDGWGNKTATFDPNAGNYSYTYDAFGQIKTETTPKGTTTMTYDDFGKLMNKKILGDSADFETDYAYNSFAQLLSETSKKAIGTPIDSFTYTYDNLHRLNNTTESNSKFIQSQTITYETYGRVKMATNTTQELLTGLSTTVVSKNNYNTYNGIMDKITDGNNQLLWKLTAANEKMQSVSEEMGNGSSIMNFYDSNNYFSSQKHYSVNLDDIVDNTYDFNGIKGTLNNRQNVVLGTNEIFTYDTLDRLTHWTNPLTNTVDSNEYDNRGRITINNKIGDVNYTNPPESGMYRKTSVTLNPEGLNYYNTIPNQTVSYTMFKSPITINESEKGATTFVYNSHLSRQSMQYGYTIPTPGATAEYTKTKLYTDDGSTEILQTATAVTIRTYIGGDAYSAPLYQQTTKNISTGVEITKKYYLHRDYLGSIIAIVDEDGIIVERRQFDAWGNLAKLEQNGVLVTADVGAMLLDRGYTSHEHLAEVGLIHMNGRLYDPVLRSFLMPDNFIQQPENTQNYNRYAYVLNNPLKYTDPSGEFIPLLAAVAIGAAIGALTYTMTALLADVPFSVGGLLKATFVGAATAAVTFGVGCAASSIFSTPAVGFLQGAYQGAVIGAITGVGGVVANAIFTGQNITLKAVLGGAVTGAVMGAVVGGIQGGIRAQNNGKEFWSGKDDYQHIKIGSGQPTTFSSKVDFSDKKYDVDRSLNLKTHVQPEGSNICTYVEKMIADDFYCVTGQDQINATWFNEVSGEKGLSLNQVVPHYEAAGYTVNQYSGVMDNQNALPWIANEMGKGRIVQFNLGYVQGHNVSVTRVAYMFDFKHNFIQLNGYKYLQGISEKTVKQIFSVWHP